MDEKDSTKIDRNTVGVVVFVAALIAIALFLPTILTQNQESDPKYVAKEKADEIFANQTRAILDNATVTCDQLIHLRVANAQGSLQVSLNGMGIYDKVRSLYNAKNCGAHWGWFED